MAEYSAVVWAKPRDLFDRDREWAALARFASAAGAGSMLAVVYGRRRHGKSVLLRQLCEVSGGFYYQAVEGTEIEQLRDLGAAYARHLRFPAAPAFAGWDQALEALLALPGDAAPVAIVLDEFPYLAAAAPSLPSRIQRALDAHRGRGPASRLVLCGSAMTVMTSLLSGQAPLRGRASTEVAMGPFGFRDAARFVSLDRDPPIAIQVHAVCGGVPGYYIDMLARDVPGDGDFDGWMVRGPLSVTRPLLHEARHLLDEESRLRDKAAYLSVLAAMADGCTTSGKIGGRLGRTASAVTHTLGALADMQLVVRRDDPLRERRPTWHIADPLLRFYAAVMRRDWARLEQGRAEEVWRDARERWRSQVLGPHFEELARAWTADHAAQLVPGGLRQVGATVVADGEHRTGYEIDVVGLGPVDSTDRVVLLGEAKHSSEPIGLAHLTRLRRLRDLLSRRGLARPDARLILFSVAGFADQLLAEETAGHVTLVDPARLYEEPG